MSRLLALGRGEHKHATKRSGHESCFSSGGQLSYTSIILEPHSQSNPFTSWAGCCAAVGFSLDVLHSYSEFTCVLIRLEEMIGCSQHRSKEGPDAYTHTHARLHIRTHIGACIVKTLLDSNALEHAPSHCVKRHTSAEFGLCHMWFTRRETTSHPSLLSVQIYLPPSPPRAYVCVYVTIRLEILTTTQHMFLWEFTFSYKCTPGKSIC